ncbi:putative two-component system response regulator [Eubacterium aggregans]|uniref:Putative two-component system response regulator n=1 Tax=Eubacterium aggregans TaxID=81409 RepID=A0A1H4EJA4_9FIRM|nr:HD domain-containing phosphohydrolase [Eubacterium aggregans]SEA85113.1 putative two-component system response regulator [Eubacterium aggregans]
MNNRYLMLQDILSNSLCLNADLKAYALESFAKEIDYHNQTELLTKLILDHSSIAKRLEQINKELAHSREVLAEAQEIALLGRWDINPTSGSMTWSKSMYAILEIDSSTPATSDLFFSFVHPDDLAQVNAMFQEMFVAQKPWVTRYRLLMKSGKIKWVHLRFYSKFDAKNALTHFYGTIQDVTEMKRAEDELAKYSQHLELLVEEKVQEISSSQMATIYALIKLSESRDDDTGAHIERTASFCRLLAQKARTVPEYADIITDTFLETIYKASPLHDIGKVGIPDSILLKPGKLTNEEFAIMRTHVQIGYDTLSKVGQQYDKNEFLTMGMDIALHHHEKWNGSGYNNGLKGAEIPLSARIMALSDVYDALRSVRVYKDAFSHEKSMEIIASSKGSHFDPVLVDVFIRHQEEFESLYESMYESME